MVGIIETKYRGYKFRSRLEARWAVLFDEIGLTWEYEKEGYILQDRSWYLPDFWVYQWDCFVEVKGDPEQLGEGLEKLTSLGYLTKKKNFMFYGPPDHDLYQIITPMMGIDNPSKILQCRRCNGHWLAHIEFYHWGPLGDCAPKCRAEKIPYLSDRLLAAFNKAKSYRF